MIGLAFLWLHPSYALIDVLDLCRQKPWSRIQGFNPGAILQPRWQAERQQRPLKCMSGGRPWWHQTKHLGPSQLRRPQRVRIHHNNLHKVMSVLHLIFSFFVLQVVRSGVPWKRCPTSKGRGVDFYWYKTTPIPRSLGAEALISSPPSLTLEPSTQDHHPPSTFSPWIKKKPKIGINFKNKKTFFAKLWKSQIL